MVDGRDFMGAPQNVDLSLDDEIQIRTHLEDTRNSWN